MRPLFTPAAACLFAAPYAIAVHRARCLEDSVALLQSGATGEWELTLGKKKPKPTEPPLDPAEAKRGRPLTPDEYKQWLKDHVQRAGPQKHIPHPHVMSVDGFKRYQSSLELKPPEAANSTMNLTLSFQKATAAMKTQIKDKLQKAVTSLQAFRNEVSRQHEEHEVWLEEQKHEQQTRAAEEKLAANKAKSREEFMKAGAEQRKARILAREQQQEEYLKEEERKLAQAIKSRDQALRENSEHEQAISQAKHWAEFHFVKAVVGQECPSDWTPILNRTGCKLAQKVLGGVDETDWRHSSPNRPAGCYWHVLSSHVAFNEDIGRPSIDVERICEKAHSASKGFLTEQYRKVVAAELMQEGMRQDALNRQEGTNAETDFDYQAASHLARVPTGLPKFVVLGRRSASVPEMKTSGASPGSPPPREEVSLIDKGENDGGDTIPPPVEPPIHSWM